MANIAAKHGHLELVKWLCGEGGFEDGGVMEYAVGSGNLELVQWLRGEKLRRGGDWDWMTCEDAIRGGHVEVLRWVRENGAPWVADTRDFAAEELGYTDDFGNLVNEDGNLVDEDGNLVPVSDSEDVRIRHLTDVEYAYHGLQ